MAGPSSRQPSAWRAATSRRAEGRHGFSLRFRCREGSATRGRAPISFPPSGRIELVNINGRIEADARLWATRLRSTGIRTAKAMTDEGAKDLLAESRDSEKKLASGRVRVEVRWPPRMSGMSRTRRDLDGQGAQGH